jgi:effector-binding domain-containing protein
MEMRKKIAVFIVIVLAGALAWLLFVKPYDYVAILEAKTLPGVVNQTLKTWSKSIEEAEIQQETDLNALKQKVVFNDSIFEFDYRIRKVNDSLSTLHIGVNLQGNNPFMRVSNLFSDSDFEKRTRATLLDFNEKLKEHLASFRVHIEGEAELTSSYCAYVPIESEQIQKAMGMMRNHSLLGDVLLENKIELKGQPFVEITEWDRSTDRIKYNFCYPISKTDSLPEEGLVFFKEFKGGPALKATYNGNYISSDRAWYALMEYAKRKGLEVEERPVEVFFNNPNMGGDALTWRADIYLPLAK